MFPTEHAESITNGKRPDVAVAAAETQGTRCTELRFAKPQPSVEESVPVVRHPTTDVDSLQ